jgi:hypothetical protein
VSNCVIRSLVINRFTGDGIEIGPPSGHDNFIEGCYLGLSLNGLIDQGNTLNGILITNGSNNTIGGLDVTNRNYISGNNTSGINITRSGSGGTATLDETPAGVFLELEGEPAWIDEVAGKLGFTEPDYITASYIQLYVNHCKRQGVAPADMVFDQTGSKSQPNPGNSEGRV